MSAPRSLHVVSSLRLSAGGPTHSVTRLCETLNALGAPAEIATVLFPDHLPWQGETPVHGFNREWPLRFQRSPGLKAFLAREMERFDLVHVHGMWEWPGLYARQQALRHGKPLVLAPRGMIEPWSLRQNPWAKHLAMAAWERKTLTSAALFHATSAQEATSLRLQGLRQPIAIIPNGIEAPPPPPRHPGATHTLAFLSRLHPKKGVRELLEAWRLLVERHPDWNLLLAGPDENGYGHEMRRLAAELGLGSPRTQFLGPLHGPEKWSFLASADLFVLPSHSENFGNVVLEALSQETPVMTTQGTPWAELPHQGCGWWVPLERLAEELEAALALSPETRMDMGRRGRTWALEMFGWPAVGNRMIRAYDWLRSGGAPPEGLEVLP